MNIEKLSLAERIRRLKSGYTAHLEYPAAAVRAMAQMPVAAYLAGHEKEQQRLGELLNLYTFHRVSYQKAAYRIQHLSQTRPAAAYEAALILALPFVRCHEHYQDLRRKNGTNTKDSAS